MRSDSQGPVVRLFMEEQIDFEPRPATGVSGADDVAGASLLGGDAASLGSDGGAALFGPALSALEFSTGSDSPAQFRQGMDAEGLARLAVWAESLARR